MTEIQIDILCTIKYLADDRRSKALPSLSMSTRNIYTAKCEKCGKEYKYQVQDWGYPGGKEREYAYCPYCNTPGPSEVTNGVINSWTIEDAPKD